MRNSSQVPPQRRRRSSERDEPGAVTSCAACESSALRAPAEPLARTLPLRRRERLGARSPMGRHGLAVPSGRAEQRRRAGSVRGGSRPGADPSRTLCAQAVVFRRLDTPRERLDLSAAVNLTTPKPQPALGTVRELGPWNNVRGLFCRCYAMLQLCETYDALSCSAYLHYCISII